MPAASVEPFFVAVRCRELNDEELQLGRLKYPHRKDLQFHSVAIIPSTTHSRRTNPDLSRSSVPLQEHNVFTDAYIALFDPDEISVLQHPVEYAKFASNNNNKLFPSSDSGVPLQCGERRFAFHHVLGPQATNQEVYRVAVAPLVTAVLQGYHATCFAYGMTGSGKSHTMIGRERQLPSSAAAKEEGHDEEADGMYFLAAKQLLDATNQQASGRDEDHYVTVVYLELYNEKLRDLLRTQPVTVGGAGGGGSRCSTPNSRSSSPAASSRRSSAGSSQFTSGSQSAASRGEREPDVVEDPVRGVHVSGTTEVRVRSLAHLRELLNLGNARRTKASTHSNAASSRSHAILQFTVHQQISKTKDLAGKLSLVDLAGSERAPVSWSSANASAGFGFGDLKRGHSVTHREQEAADRRREGANINRSLLSLGNCINALANNPSKTTTTSSSSAAVHIPYRDSKLTRLLKESLGGNTRTAMIATISPSCLFYEETVSTLKYATRAKAIRHLVTPNVTEHSAAPLPLPLGPPPPLPAAAEKLAPQSAPLATMSNADSPPAGPPRSTVIPTAPSSNKDLQSRGLPSTDSPQPSRSAAPAESPASLATDIERLKAQLRVTALTNATLRRGEYGGISTPQYTPSPSFLPPRQAPPLAPRGEVIEVADRMGLPSVPPHHRGVERTTVAMTNETTLRPHQHVVHVDPRSGGAASLYDDEDDPDETLQRCYQLQSKLLKLLENSSQETNNNNKISSSVTHPTMIAGQSRATPVTLFKEGHPNELRSKGKGSIASGDSSVRDVIRRFYEAEQNSSRQVDHFLGL